MNIPYIWSLPENQKALDYTINYSHKDCHFCTTYDLLPLEADRAEIIRWTMAGSIPLGELIGHPCSEIDLFLFRQAFDYSPEQILLSYWFLSQKQDIKLSIPYNNQNHDYFRQQLKQLLHDSRVNSPATAFTPGTSLTERFLKGEITATQYLDAIPEVEL